MRIKFNKTYEDIDLENDEEKNASQAIRALKRDRLLNKIKNIHAASCVRNGQSNERCPEYESKKFKSTEIVVEERDNQTYSNMKRQK